MRSDWHGFKLIILLTQKEYYMILFKSQIKRNFFQILLIFYCITFNSLVYAADKPENTLWEIQNAIDEANGSEFQNQVDLQPILQNLLNSFLKYCKKPDSALAGNVLIKLFTEQLEASPAIKDLCLKEAETFVLNGINSGAFAGRPVNPANLSGLLSPIFANTSMGKKQIISVGEAKKANGEGNIYLIPFVLHDYGNENDYPIIGEFEQTGKNIWRMINIVNIDDLVAQIASENNL